jgi:16S rRNA processing protein RimM
MDAPENDWVWLAQIRRPQGRKGEVFAEILTDFPEKFAVRRSLWLLPEAESNSRGAHKSKSPQGVTTADASARPVELLHHWLHKGGIVLHFAGVNSISDAETLAGNIVAIPREERAALAEDEFYLADLIGCRLVDISHSGDPQIIGEIENVEREAGPVPLLIVRADGREILIPFAKKYLRSLDTNSRTVQMELPEGLVDLND